MTRIRNKDLTAKYDRMHSQGKSAWFSDGDNERKIIMAIGEPWGPLKVLEIGCGEGDLCSLMHEKGTYPCGVDYSEEAIKKAKRKYRDDILFWCGNYREVKNSLLGRFAPFDRIVMQGVIEHFDEPWSDLLWIIDNLMTPGGDIITSSPCFINTRGVVWMTLATLMDVPMSLTDLHFLHPLDFAFFADKHGMGIETTTTDHGWGGCRDMVRDLSQRLPKALAGVQPEKIERFMEWLDAYSLDLDAKNYGATAVYRLWRN